METLPGIMPGNTLTPLPLPPPSVPLFIFDSLFLSSSVCRNNEPAAPLPPFPSLNNDYLLGERGAR